MASNVETVAAELAAALRSGNAQASEAALDHYEALDLDVDPDSLNLGPLKRVLSPEEAESVSEVGGGTEADQEAAVSNASDDTPATTTINAGPEKTMDEISQPIASVEDLDVSPAARALAEEKGVDLSEIKGSGVDGKIVKGDVEEAVS